MRGLDELEKTCVGRESVRIREDEVYRERMDRF